MPDLSAADVDLIGEALSGLYAVPGRREPVLDLLRRHPELCVIFDTSFVPPFELVVFGSPAPQGSKKAVGQRNGRTVLVESSRAVKPWRKAVVDAVAYQRTLLGVSTPEPLNGPLVARMVFTLRKPASAPKRTRSWPDTRPDLSKLIRSTEDALTDAGVWADDGRVVDYSRTAKVYPGEDPEALARPGVRIRVHRLIPLESA